MEQEGGHGPAAHQPDLGAVWRQRLPSSPPPPCGDWRNLKPLGKQHVAQSAAPVQPPCCYGHLGQQLLPRQPEQLLAWRLDCGGGGDPALNTTNQRVDRPMSKPIKEIV